MVIQMWGLCNISQRLCQFCLGLQLLIIFISVLIVSAIDWFITYKMTTIDKNARFNFTDP